jgi:hypothetical protein
MKRQLQICGIIAVTAILWPVLWNRLSPTDSVEYQGQPVKLSKSYFDYDDYKNDPDNLAPGEADKVQQLVESAPVPKHFADRKQLARAMFDLKFPGYGLGAYGEKPQPDGSVLALFGVEIPKSGTMRFLLFRGRDGRYTLIDDFVHADTAGIMSVTASGDNFVYSTLQGRKVLERAPSVE